MASLSGRHWRRWLWLVSAGVWLPALDAVLGLPDLLRPAIAAAAGAACLIPVRAGAALAGPSVVASRSLLPVALLVAAPVLLLLWPAGPPVPQRAALPLRTPAAVGVAIAVSAHERAVYGAAEVTKRLYRIHGGEALVTIIDGSRNRHALHDPTYCLRGSGWHLAGREDLALPRGAGVMATVERGDQSAQLAWWFTDGGRQWGGALRTVAAGSLGRILGLPAPSLILIEARHVPVAEVLLAIPALSAW